MRKFYVVRILNFPRFFPGRGKVTVKQTVIPCSSYTSGPSLKIKIIVIRSLFCVRYPETFLFIQYVLPTCISKRASIMLFSAFAINTFSSGNRSFHSVVCFSIATHDSFQNSSLGFAEMTRGFLY